MRSAPLGRRYDSAPLGSGGAGSCDSLISRVASKQAWTHAHWSPPSADTSCPFLYSAPPWPSGAMPSLGVTLRRRMSTRAVCSSEGAAAAGLTRADVDRVSRGAGVALRPPLLTGAAASRCRAVGSELVLFSSGRFGGCAPEFILAAMPARGSLLPVALSARDGRLVGALEGISLGVVVGAESGRTARGFPPAVAGTASRPPGSPVDGDAEPEERREERADCSRRACICPVFFRYAACALCSMMAIELCGPAERRATYAAWVYASSACAPCPRCSSSTAWL
mmetsp:Transcript_16162/g.41288  ORF Transcript_16162/g.41288 Transcript_16162/m.41288 type:complete len:281 (+) Transcript_16162:490-1332(+)